MYTYLPRLLFIDSECLFAEHMFTREQAQHRVLIMMTVRCRHIYDVHIGVLDKLFIRPVGFGVLGALAGLEELLGAVCRGGTGGRGDSVSDI